MCPSGRRGRPAKPDHRGSTPLTGSTVDLHALVAQPGQSTWLRTKVARVQILPGAQFRWGRGLIGEDAGLQNRMMGVRVLPAPPTSRTWLRWIERQLAELEAGGSSPPVRATQRCRSAQPEGRLLESQSDNTRAGQQARSRPGGYRGGDGPPGPRRGSTPRPRPASLSSVGRALRLHRRGPGFDPWSDDRGGVVQPGRTPALQADRRGFKSPRLHHHSKGM